MQMITQFSLLLMNMFLIILIIATEIDYLYVKMRPDIK